MINTKFIRSYFGESLGMGWGRKVDALGNVLVIGLNGRFVGIHYIL